MTSILFTVQVTARPENLGDGNNERYSAQAFATNGTPLHYRGEGPTLAAAFRQFASAVNEHEHAFSKKQKEDEADLRVNHEDQTYG